MLAIIDISRELSDTTEVYAGDEPFARAHTCTIENGDSTNVTAVRGTSHAATHVDHPHHLFDNAVEPPLEAFMGEALVIALGEPLPTLAPSSRVLVKANEALPPDLVSLFVASRVALVGVETMSVDTLNSVDLPNHHALLGAGIAILENLDLAHVPAGTYELVALPLNIPNADATWVRAVLRTL